MSGVDSGGWISPLAETDPNKPTVKVQACLGCSRLPEGHPGEEICLRAEVKRLRLEVAGLRGKR